MRTCLLVLILAAPMVGESSFGQSVALLTTKYPGLDVPFYDSNGILLSGTNYMAQLYAGHSTRFLRPYLPTVFFRTGSGAGYIQGRNVILTGFDPCGGAWVEVRAWEAAGGASVEEAAKAGAWTGLSAILWQSSLGGCAVGAPTPPVPLYGLQYPGPPLLVSNPQSRKARVGESIPFSVIVSGGITVFYQWYYGSSGDTNQPIVGATNSTFVTPPLAGDFSCWAQAWTAVGSTNSATATATVYPANSLILELMVENELERFTIHAPPGKTYQLQSAAGLENAAWNAVTNLVIPTTPLQYQQPMETNSSARFYRLSGTP